MAELKQFARSPVGVLTVLAVVIGVGILVYSMRWGPWVIGDSVEYFEAARNISRGRGPVLERASGRIVPLALRPPLYPTVLAVPMLIGFAPAEAAYLINILAFAGLMLFLGFVAHNLPQPVFSALALFVLFLSSPVVLRIFTGAMSEPIYLLLTIACMALFALQGTLKGKHPLIPAAFLAGLSFLTRFTGAVTVSSYLVGLAALSTEPWRRRLKSLGALALVAFVPFAAWWSYLRFAGVSIGAPSELPSSSLWAQLAPWRIAMVESMWRWLPFGTNLPSVAYRIQLLGLLFVFGLMVAGAGISFLHVRREGVAGPRRQFAAHLQVFGMIFVSIYVLFLAATFVLVRYPQPEINERMVAPVLIIAYVVWLAILVSLIAGLLGRATGLVFASGLIAAMLVWQLPGALGQMSLLHDEGSGYTSRSWRRSPLVELAQDIPPGTPVISNEADALQFYLGRPVFQLEGTDCRDVNEPFYRFGEDPDCPTDRVFRDQAAALVLFDTVYWAFEPIFQERTEDRLQAFTDGLRIDAETRLGGVYFYPDE